MNSFVSRSNSYPGVSELGIPISFNGTDLSPETWFTDSDEKWKGVLSKIRIEENICIRVQ